MNHDPPDSKGGRNAMFPNVLFIDKLFVVDNDVVGEVGQGFCFLLGGLNTKCRVFPMPHLALGNSPFVVVQNAAWRIEKGLSAGWESNAAK